MIFVRSANADCFFEQGHLSSSRAAKSGRTTHQLLVHGGNCETVNVALRREELTDTIVALEGIDTSEVRLGSGSIEVPTAYLPQLRHTVVSKRKDHITADLKNARLPGAHDILTRSIIESISDLLLQVRPATCWEAEVLPFKYTGKSGGYVSPGLG